MTDQQLIHRMALSMLKGVGPINARELVAWGGGVDELFTDPNIHRKLEKATGVGKRIAASLANKKVLEQARRELEYVRKHNIRTLFFQDQDYPVRLKQCPDAPTLLYVKGNADLDAARMVAVVGTRKATDRGRKHCEQLIEALAATGASIISGLAYGVDITAHRTAIKLGLPTIASVAHGLDRLYPSEHANTARELEKNGAMVAELPSGSPFAPGNFPARNRVIAGLADCTIVVESAKKGGSLITADIANSYDREVYAIPGRVDDKYSDGCNRLIQMNRAALITSGEDVVRMMGWEPKKGRQVRQPKLFLDLAPEEQQLVDIIKVSGKISIDELCIKSHLSQGVASSLLLNMEFNGVVRSLPGKVYELN